MSMFSMFRRVYKCLHDLRLEEGISTTARKIALGTARTVYSELVCGLCTELFSGINHLTQNPRA